ncbi:hypothetical protein ATCV1_z251L [Acanthocystis turfacea chlorella virus 1]|uniref:Uncharacterized protein z251L n=1 Tax=Chlorovirus heliozoae TaxID=322019 RepID=A7K8L1_9PHYC|nr:hypothetical protein ATCV1_z251L [Acanthocystis turfacea chlorella virus 1]ABT16385.1 hypothetical protein ATCV1_z251L [Acanthocystis turfacea chlorella virus 1]
MIPRLVMTRWCVLKKSRMAENRVLPSLLVSRVASSPVSGMSRLSTMLWCSAKNLLKAEVCLVVEDIVDGVCYCSYPCPCFIPKPSI